MTHNSAYNKPPMHQQRGAALLILVMVLLVVLTTIVTTASRSVVLETRMTANFIDKKAAYNSANSATFAALTDINQDFNIDNYISSSQHSGFYDLRRQGSVSAQTKRQDEWDQLLTLTSIKTDSLLKQQDTPFILKDEPDYLKDVKQLSRTPSYAIGIHDVFAREGTEGIYCTPVSVVGVSLGESSSTLSMVELKTVPKAGCFRSKIH